MKPRPSPARGAWPFTGMNSVAQNNAEIAAGRCICLTERPFHGATFTQIITPAVGCPHHDKGRK